MRMRLGFVVVALVVATIASGCEVTGFDPGMAKRCYLNARWAYTPDCPWLPAGAPHWGIGTPHDQERYVGMHDVTTGWQVNPNTPFQTALSRPAPGSPIKGLQLETWLKAGVNTQNLADHEVNLAVNNWNVNNRLRGLKSVHTIALLSKSGTSSAEYGVFFRGPNGQMYTLNYVLAPFGSNVPPMDSHVVFKGCTWHCGKPDQVNVIKLNSREFGAPRIDNGLVTITIDWERLLNYIHSRGWWPNITPDMTVLREWFQLQAWGAGSPTAGGIRTIQGNWTMLYR
jgi:hypothetical protein